MGVTKEVLLSHLDYSRWASLRLLAAVADLPVEDLNRDFGTADRSALGTLVHVFAADRIWLKRVTSQPITSFVEEADHRLETLQRDWPAIHAGWRNWMLALPEVDLHRGVDYADMSGRAWSHQPWQIVMHVVNHATHHRGQVSGFLRTLQRTPPPLDLILFHRESAA